MAAVFDVFSSMYHMTLNDTPQFVAQISEKYTCTFCNSWLRPPVSQTECGHRYCHVCIEQLLNEGGHVCYGRERSCQLLNRSTIYPDRGTDRDLGNMKVYCRNRPKCSVITEWKILAKHMAVCEFNTMLCPNDGCSVVILVRDLDIHRKRECHFNPAECSFCSKKFTKEMLTDHEKRCKYELIKCDFGDEGCNLEDTRAQMKAHYDNKRELHLKLLKQKSDTILAQKTQLKMTLQDLQNKSATKDRAIKKLSSDQDDLSIMFKVYDRKTQEHLAEIEQTSQSASNAKAAIRHEEDLHRLEHRVAAIENNSQQTGGYASMKNRISEEDKKLLESQDRMLAMHDVSLAEYEIRFRCLETANYNGILIWKITNYRKRKQFAVDGRTLSIYSQPFYTHPYGYKMCARIYLNGDGLGKTSHASLYFVIMKGEYDALLQWPFTQRVSMILLDQDGGRHPIQDKFRPDPTSSSFQRPVNAMNIASGSPLFVAQSILESERYLKDDTIYIMMKVDISDLNHFGL